jgi:hypothetical protein
MKIEIQKKNKENGDIIYRSICKYEVNGLKKQINVEAFSPMNLDFFYKFINNNYFFNYGR